MFGAGGIAKLVVVVHSQDSGNLQEYNVLDSEANYNMFKAHLKFPHVASSTEVYGCLDHHNEPSLDSTFGFYHMTFDSSQKVTDLRVQIFDS